VCDPRATIPPEGVLSSLVNMRVPIAPRNAILRKLVNYSRGDHRYRIRTRRNFVFARDIP
jgi:hypothetical protein